MTSNGWINSYLIVTSTLTPASRLYEWCSVGFSPLQQAFLLCFNNGKPSVNWFNCTRYHSNYEVHRSPKSVAACKVMKRIRHLPRRWNLGFRSFYLYDHMAVSFCVLRISRCSGCAILRRLAGKLVVWFVQQFTTLHLEKWISLTKSLFFAFSATDSQFFFTPGSFSFELIAV
jgi:hypothetical protein